MSVFVNKQVFLVGEKTNQISSLKSELESRNVIVSELECKDLNESLKPTKAVDLIIFNHTRNCELCPDLKSVFNGDNYSALVPVFTLVDDTSDAIQKTLSDGAADYITQEESIASIMQKVEAVFSEDDVFSGSSSIDISPIKPEISTTGIRVFVVEDDPLLRNLLSIRFDKSSFPYEFSKDGRDIVPVVEQFRPDVIILDLMLPGKSGFDVLTELKAEKNLQSIPVVVFSNKDGNEDRDKAKKLGAESFFVKAMTDLSELTETIEKLVKK